MTISTSEAMLDRLNRASEYRDGWERAFGVPQKTPMSSGFSLPFGTYGIYAHPSMPENELRLLTVKDGEPSVFKITNIGREEITGYPNGCPILSEDNGRE